MPIETYPELYQFTQTWKGKCKEQVVEEISSYCLDTLGTYPTSRVIISEIEEQDRAIVLDINEKECQKFTDDLEKYSTNHPFLSSLDQIRSTPLILNASGTAVLFGKEHFDCPRCKGKIELGKGVTTCPHCGAKKEDYKTYN